MSLTNRSLASQAFKLSQRVAHTANNKDFYNEAEESSYVVFAKDIWANVIDSDPTVAVAGGFATQVRLRLKNVFASAEVNPTAYLAMFYWEDQTVSTKTALTGKTNPRTGTLYSDTAGETPGNGNGQRVGHIIPTVLNDFKVTDGGYRPVITKSDLSTTIASGHPSDWFLDSFAGVVVHELDSESDYMLLNGGSAGAGSYTGGDELATMDCYIYNGLFLTEALDISSGAGAGGSLPANTQEVIDSLIQQVGTLNVQVEAISGNLGDLQNNFNILETNVDNISADLGDLEVRVGDLENSSGIANTYINNITSDVNSLQNQFNTLDTSVDDISSALSNYAPLAGENIFTGDENVFTGNVTVQGTFTAALSSYLVTSQNTTVSGALLYLNRGEPTPGVTTGEAGLIIDRGPGTPEYKMVFDENRDSMVIGFSGQEDIVATRTTDPVQSGVLVIGDSDGKNFKQDGSIAWDGETLNVAGGLTLTVSGSGAGDVVTRSEVETMIADLAVGDVTQADLNALSGAVDYRLAELQQTIVQDAVTQTDLDNLSGALTDRMDDIALSVSNIVGASGNVIGPAEDGTYTDGLFADFTNSTPVGHAIDRINEILKAIAPPSPYPFDNISFTQQGVKGNLSFGTLNTLDLTDYEPVPGKNEGATFNNNTTERGIFVDAGSVSGVVNVKPEGSNGAFPANAFLDGDQGTLELWVNGSMAHSIDLSTYDVGVDGTSALNANGSGFTSLINSSPVQLVGEASTVDIDALQFRTANWVVSSNDYRNGYNEIYVIHRVSGTPRPSASPTPYKFVVDADTTVTVFTSQTLSAPSMGSTKYLSGVLYYTGGQIPYSVTVENIYKNTYVTADTPFNVAGTNIQGTNIPLEAIGAPINNQEKTFDISTTLPISPGSSQRIIGEDVSVYSTAYRTVQGTLSSTPLNSGEKYLIDAKSPTSDDLNEYFDDERYRMYAVTNLNDTSYGAGPSNSPYTYDSSISLNPSASQLPASYDRPLMVFDGRLRYPTKTTGGVPSGNFGSITQPNLSGFTYAGLTGVRYYYRYFYLGNNFQNFGIRVLGDGNNWITASSLDGGGSPSFSTSSQIMMQILAPNTTTNANVGGVTEWKDAYREFDGPPTIGIHQASLQASLPSTQYRGYTLGSKSTTTSGGVIVVRFIVPNDWSGTIDSITVFPVVNIVQ